ncbi:MAG: hypothetical protein RLZZ15_2538 [Verrucomicrobiota bacterium]|jgi:hypothetical protein
MKLQLARPSTLTLSRALAFLGTAVAANAVTLTPEPADFAVGFGGLALGFIVWRNFRRTRKNGADAS